MIVKFNKGLKMSIKPVLAVALLLGSVSALAKPQPSVVNIQNWQTTNGARVFFVSLNQLPIVDVKVGFAAGSVFDGDRAGIAALTNSMLDEGTQKRNSDQIAEAFDNVGSKFHQDVGRDFAWVSFRSLSDSKYLDPTVDAFADALGHSTFPQKAFQRVKKQTIVGLQYHEQLPSKVAKKAFYRSIYGAHPYEHPTIGELRSVKAMTIADLKAFYHQYYVAKNATIVVAGDLTRRSAEKLAEKISNGLPAGQRAIHKPEITTTKAPGSKKINFPSAQTHVMIGQVGIKKGSEDYFPAFVGNYVLGGGVFNSRLMKIIREDRGYAYHVASRFVTMREKGPFVIQLQTRTKEAQNAADLVHETLQEFITKGPTAEELTLAKRSITQSFPLNLASNAAIVGNVATIAAYNLPLNYLDTYRDNVENVSAQDIKRTFGKLIKDDRLVTISVGKTNG